MSESLLISTEGRLRRLTLNRPDKRNALSADLCRSVTEAVHEAASDAAIGAILLDAEGKDFCSGMDLGEVL
jgi:enoyl-CoA hydratase/carnithine racemase